MTVLRVQLELCETINVENVGSVNPDELCWIEAGFDFAKCLLLKKLFRFRAERHVIILCLYVVDLRNGNDVNICAIPNGNALNVSPRWSRRCGEFGCRKTLLRLQAESSAVQGFPQPFRAEWFQQVI